MLIIGANGFAKQLFEDISPEDYLGLSFFDDINLGTNKLWNEYPILHTESEAKNYFEHVDDRFVLGVGTPGHRYYLSEKFRQLKGKLINMVSPGSITSRYAHIGSEGVNILKGVIIEADVSIGNGCLINLNAIITHDCTIGEYTSVSPGVIVSGRCAIGRFCEIGAGTVILPKLKIGDSVIIGAGAVVTKDIPDNSKVMGIPARSKK